MKYSINEPFTIPWWADMQAEATKKATKQLWVEDNDAKAKYYYKLSSFCNQRIEEKQIAMQSKFNMLENDMYAMKQDIMNRNH